MIQIVDSLTNPIVILYNIGIIAMFIAWIYQDRLPLKKIVTEGRLLYWYIFSFFWLIFSLIANFFFLGSDVDDAIISATQAFVAGANPYVYDVVVHLLNGKVVFGVYHYFPSDLLAYSSMYLYFRPLIQTYPQLLNSWFFFSNVLFLTGGYFFVRKILDHVEDKRLIPIYVFVTCFFLFTNSSLLVLYFSMGFYFIDKLKRHNSGITAYVLGAGVKYITGLLIFVQVIEEFSRVKELKDLKFLRPYIVGTIVFIILIIPFGILHTLDATFLYQLEVKSRSQVAGIYGPLLIEAVLAFNILPYFSIIFLIASVLSIFVTFKFGKTTYEREMILSFLFMLILPFYGTELLIVPILLWFFKLFDVELNFPQTSSYFKSKE